MDNQKSAYIAIVGRPNVGKSTILNKLIGEKIAIVSKKPQTTRTRIMGVLTEGEDQLVFLDTPGLLKPRNSLGDYMLRSVTAAIEGVDSCLLVAQAGAPLSKADEELIGRFKKGHIPAVLAINKTDLLGDKTRLMEQIAEYSGLYDFEAVVPVSAEKGDGMDALLDELKGLTLPGGWLFPEDTLTDQTEPVLAAELVREKALRLLEQEVPHGVAAVTEHMQEKGELLEIHVTLYCEKPNHKGILIGKGGEMLKRIGSAARRDLEEFFGCRVNLQLWVKVKEDWRQRPETLQGMGFSLRDLEI
ncbi:GTPase Era [Acutalibacter muris]|uniref:GTPase Era n=1 Tax=Acutalibacter muris TaxID=1796620 RepID=A0A1Z2XUF0_9FIRM|nr:GTPase Era [Acutalibacter muris]ANU54691.1 GTPase Era [Hungateiclostridiaceae bacterium KB18]ASB42078.1 GTPase Era [Acutalibacter muris]QQR31347.1 GTPase Era [Acutalibacter muris]